MFGLTLSFVATRSGLLRWTDHAPQPPDSAEPYVSYLHIRSNKFTHVGINTIHTSIY